VVRSFEDKLNVRYFFKKNSGQGFSRNFGFECAKGDYFVQLDSDAIIPSNYFEIVDNHLKNHWLDAYGGPDAAHESFTDVQKAINYAMTSFFTTGGIRGKKNNVGGAFHPRSFNFGLSRKVWESTKGYRWTRMAEDIEFSIRIIEAGFQVGLISEAFIYHKRRTSFVQFFKQLHFFGRGRINLSKFFPKELKLVHFFPACFTLFLISIPFLLLFVPSLGKIASLLLIFYILIIFLDAFRQTKSINIGFLSTLACFVQLVAYGLGFMREIASGNRQ
jgi:glycosyltransferase involved in cell wall biosynthesis